MRLTMKLTLALIAQCIVVLAAYLSPPHIQHKLTSPFLPATDESRCFAVYKEKFRDGWRAFPVGGFVASREKSASTYYTFMRLDDRYKKFDEVLSVKVSIINRFGARDFEYIECPFVDGKFDKLQAEIWAIGSPVEG